MRIAILAFLFTILGVHTEDGMLVTSAWLAEHLRDPAVVLIEIGPKDSYDTGHIPGGRYVDFHAFAAPHQMGPDHEAPKPGTVPALYLELPPAGQLDSLLGSLGISAHSRVVVSFSGDWVTPAARVYLTLDYAGLRGRVSLLDGGLTAWRAEGRPLSKETPPTRAGSFHSTPESDVVVSASWVTSHLQDPQVKVVDARSPEFYLDTVDNMMPRGGHIAGAVNIPFEDLVDSTTMRLKDTPELARIFRAAGVRQGQTVVGYCHIGQQASLVYFAARRLGYEARLYDGSFQEWSAHPDWPIEGSHRAATGH